MEEVDVYYTKCMLKGLSAVYKLSLTDTDVTVAVASKLANRLFHVLGKDYTKYCMAS